MVFIDTKTKQVLRQAPSPDVPALNPATGTKTLVPAGYCDKCQRWDPLPALEVLQRNPALLRCPKTKTELRFDGPIPAG